MNNNMTIEKKRIVIPEQVFTYLEGLSYVAEGYKQLIRHLTYQEVKDIEYLNILSEKYMEIYSQYRVALNEICKQYAQTELEEEYNIIPNFSLGVLVASKRRINNDNSSEKSD